MGCMGFGNAKTGQHSWTVDEETSGAIIKRGLELGINFFDTAIAYQAGTSEEYLGKAIREYARREEIVIATKFLPRSQEEIADGTDGFFAAKWHYCVNSAACAVDPDYLV